MEAQLNWQTHSAWASESVARLFNLRSSDAYKKILAELPKNPDGLADAALAMSASFAIHCLEALAKEHKNEVSEEKIAILITRCLNLILEADSRPTLNFSKSNQKKIINYLKSIDTKEDSKAPFWSWFFCGAPLDNFDEILIHEPPREAQYSSIEELTLANEPFLAWKKIKDLQENLPYLEYMNLGLFADPEMIKYEIRKNKASAEALFVLYLILFAREGFCWLEDETLRRSLKKLISCGSDFAQFLRLLVFVGQDDKDFSLSHALQLRQLLILVGSLPLIQKLIGIAAIHSIARKKRWAHLSEKFYTYYRRLSLKTSAGLTDNLWNLIRQDGSQKTKVIFSEISSSIPSSKMTRSFETTSITFKLIGLLGSRRVAKIISGQAHTISLSEKETDSILKILIPYFSKMKGPMMKLGQTFSYTHFGLPPHLFAQFGFLQSDSNSLDFQTIYKEIQKNEKLNSQILAMEPLPIGVGSLGQVHRAKLRDGRQVAVKVKFPNIERVIEEDFDILKFIIGLIDLFVPRLRLKSYVKELRQQILLECDYTREAKSQNFHREKMKYLKSLYIPEVYADLCSEHILVSEYVEGMKFKEACRGATQSQKDLWGKTLVEYTVASCRDGHFNSDPHPGNLLFQRDRLVYLDFGSVREWEVSVSNSWNYLIMTSLLGKQELVFKAFTELQSSALNPKAVQNLAAVLKNQVPGSWTVPGLQALSESSLSDQMSQFAQVTYSRKNAVHLPKEFLLGMRVYFGHLSVVSTLGSQADWFELANRIMSPWSQQHL